MRYFYNEVENAWGLNDQELLFVKRTTPHIVIRHYDYAPLSAREISTLWSGY